MKRRVWVAGVGLGWLGLAVPAHGSRVPLRTIEQRLFGGPLRLVVPATAPEPLLNAVLHGLASINAQWNAWKPGEVTEVNRAFAGQRSVAMSPALRALLLRARDFERRSAGRFNAAIGASVAAWGFHADRLRDGPAPSAAGLSALRSAAPSLDRLGFEGTRVWSRCAKVQLDFGGCAKGVALDWALDRLRAGGVPDALLDLGGNLAAMGQAGGRPWRVGIRDPLGAGLVAALAVGDREAVVTSGSYERWRLADGQRVAHIIDPWTARPARALLGVTVVHRDAALADAAATALLVAGPVPWPAVAARLGVEQVLAIEPDGRLSATPRMRLRLNAPSG